VSRSISFDLAGIDEFKETEGDKKRCDVQRKRDSMRQYLAGPPATRGLNGRVGNARNVART
jgi:hypothetical protein